MGAKRREEGGWRRGGAAPSYPAKHGACMGGREKYRIEEGKRELPGLQLVTFAGAGQARNLHDWK